MSRNRAKNKTLAAPHRAPTPKIKIKLPESDAPGYLSRERERLAVLNAPLNERRKPEYIDRMAQLILKYTIEPVDRDKALAAIMELTENQFDAILEALTGNVSSANPTLSAQPTQSPKQS